MLNLLRIIYYKIYSYIYIKFFIYLKKIKKNKYILFSHSSTGDTFYIASLIDKFCENHGQIDLIISESHIETFRIFVQSKKVNYVVLSEKNCLHLRSIIYWDASYQLEILQKGVIKPLHLVLYKNLLELINTRRLFNRDALTWLMCLEKTTIFKYPEYNHNDNLLVNNILNKISHNHKNIVLINPICYTHMALPNEVWEQIANVFIKNGYKVIFNLMRNFNDTDKSNLYKNYNQVFIPAYLVPLLSERIAFACSRWGGGFDLIHSFSINSKAILINLSDNLQTDVAKIKDPSETISNEIFIHLCNKKIFKIITLTEMKCNQDTINSIEKILS